MGEVICEALGLGERAARIAPDEMDADQERKSPAFPLRPLWLGRDGRRWCLLG